MKFLLVEEDKKKDNYLAESNLQESDSLGNPLTPEQVKFFANSKVRDSKGNLLVCYHGTGSEFNTFDDNRTSWFTPNDYYARSFNSKHLHSCYLNITNPFYLGDIDDWFWTEDEYDEATDSCPVTTTVKNIANQLKVDIQTLIDIYEYYDYTNNVYRLTNSVEFRQLVIEKGFDGLQAEETVDVTFGAFNSNQIKSITNTNPTNSNNINESLSKNNLLDFMYNNLPLQKEPYFWSTFIMPDGRFINISEIDTGDEWNSSEHEEVYNYIYNHNGEMFVDDREIVNDLGCIKLNITYPYIALSDSVRPTPAQYKSLRNWIDNASSEFDYEIRSCEDTGSVKCPIAINKWSDYKIYDLGTMDSYDIIKAIQKSYSSGILESKRNEMKETMSTSIKPGDRVKMDYYAKSNNGATGTCKGRIGQLCSIEWDDGSKSKEITTYLTKIDNVDESNELEQRAKKHKKKSKGMGWHMSMNAGDVEKGIEIFNNSTSLGTSSGEGTAMGEAVESNTYYYNGPIYYRGHKIAEKSDIYTTAKSLNVAIRNVLYKASQGDRDNLYQYDIVDQLVKEIPKEETPKIRPKCQMCGYEINDIGDCPVCDYGEDDLLESLSDLEALWTLKNLD